MDLNSTFGRSDDVVSREVSGEMVLLHLESGTYFGLDPVGSRIWELMAEGPLSLSTICDTIEEEFDAARDQIETDTISLFNDLQAENLVEAQTA